MMKYLKKILIFFVILVVAYVVVELYFFSEIISRENLNLGLEKGIEYYQKGNYIKSTKFLSAHYYGLFPEENNVSHVNKVALLNTFGMRDKAVETIKTGLKENPDNRTLNLMLGMKYLEDKNYSEAEKYIKRSATYDGITSYTYSNLGNVYLKFNEPEKAIEAYDEAISLIPKLKTEKEKTARIKKERLNRAIACVQAGEYEDALHDCEFLIKQKLVPCISPAQVYYLMSISKTGLKDYAGALREINTAISISKIPLAKYQVQKSLIYLEQKDFKKAELFIKYALQSYPEDKYANATYALILLQDKEYKTALEHINNVNKKFEEPFLLMLKAQALYGLDKKKQAITLMKKLVKKYPHEKEFEKVLNKMLNGGDSLHGSYEAIINFLENNQYSY